MEGTVVRIDGKIGPEKIKVSVLVGVLAGLS